MITWAIANQKGGVGKTTTAVTLAGLLAARGQSVLMVDLDPHGSLTSYFGLDPDTIEASAYQLFRSDEVTADVVLSLIQPTPTPKLFLLPASTAMATLDRQLGARDGMGLVLARALASLTSSYEHAIVDCPPMLGVLMVNAIGACERLIVPVQTEFLALKGLERMMHTLEMIQRARRTPLAYTIVPTLFDRRTHASVETLRMLQERYGDHLWNGVIPVDTQLREASRAGSPLSSLSQSARSVQAYTALLDHLMTPAMPAGLAEVKQA
jgi:chromosome partitioning protein